MGLKSKQKYLKFFDFEKSSQDEKNKSLETLNLEKTITWDRMDAILMKDYPVGNKKEGNIAYPKDDKTLQAFLKLMVGP